MPSRRALLGGLGVGLAATLSGCSTLASVDGANCWVSELSPTSGRCEVGVENLGPGGDFWIILKYKDDDGQVIGEERSRIHIGFWESRSVVIDIDMNRGSDIEPAIESA